MKIPKNGASLKQIAYARRAWGAKDQTKRAIALNVGYSPSVANSCVSKIESKKGFNNAMAKLAAESNNLALSILHEFKARGVTDFTNKDLIGALNAIAGAWDKFNKGLAEASRPPEDNGKNRLRTVVLQNINKQVMNTQSPPEQVIIDADTEEKNEEEEEIIEEEPEVTDTEIEDVGF